VSIRLSAMLQHFESKGAPFADSQLAPFEQSYPRDTGILTNQIVLYTARITAKIGAAAELTSVTGFSYNQLPETFNDYTVGGLSQIFYGVPYAADPAHYSTQKFTQEIRLSTPIGDRVDSLFGVFYTHEKSYEDFDIFAVQATGERVVHWLNDI